MTGSSLFGRVIDQPYSGWLCFYRQRREKTGTRSAPVVAGKTGCEAPALQNPNHWPNSACCIAGLLLILILSACGPANETGGPQRGQTAAQTEFPGKHPPKQVLPQGGRFRYAPDEVLVKFKPEVDARTINEIRKALKLEMIQKFSSPNLFLMKIADGATVETIIRRLNAYDAVKYAEPNYGVKTTQ
jgi:hypothetical protein